MTQLPISSLREGHLIDLEQISDWLGLDPSDEHDENVLISMEFEYAAVEGGELESSECYRLDTSQGSYGLPPDLLVTIQGALRRGLEV